MNRKKLTIAIPTFNRNATLVNNLACLIPQLTEECELLILDNCSSVPVENSIIDGNILNEGKEVNLRIKRSVANIGGSANFVRCFELSQGCWTWLLGDDDEPNSNAIEIILKKINENPDALFINFSSYYGKNNDSIGTGLNRFLLEMDSFSNTLFISTGIYKTSRIKEKLFVGYNATYTAASHLAMLLAAFQKEDVFCLSSQEIVSYEKIPIEERWSPLKINSKLASLPEAIYVNVSSENFRVLNKRIFETHGLRTFRHVAWVFVSTVLHCKHSPEEASSCQFYFNQWTLKSRGIGTYDNMVKSFSRMLAKMMPFNRISLLLSKIVLFISKKKEAAVNALPSSKREDF